MNLVAFHNDKKVKKKYLDRVKLHQKADEIIKGKYWESGKGCAVGCTIHSSDHNQYETQLGIPTWLAVVEDRLFEGMNFKDAKSWPSKFLNAINVGADLEKVKAPFMVFILESALEKFDHKKYPKCAESIENVIKLYKDKKATIEDFKKARDAAADAAADAAYADAAYAAYAAADAAAYAAYAAADAAAAYAAYAAADAADAAYAAADAAADARQKEYLKFANHLLKLLKECK